MVTAAPAAKEPEPKSGSDPIAAYLQVVHRELQRRVQRERGFSRGSRRAEETCLVSFHITAQGRLIFEEIGGGASPANANRLREILSGLRLPIPPEALSPTRILRVPLIIKSR